MLNAFVAGLILGSTALHGQTDPGAVKLERSESARIWFNAWWPKTTGAMETPSKIDDGITGELSPAHRDQTLLRLNISGRRLGE